MKLYNKLAKICLETSRRNRVRLICDFFEAEKTEGWDRNIFLDEVVKEIKLMDKGERWLLKKKNGRS